MFEQEEGIEFYTKRFSVMAVVIIALASAYAVIFGNMASIILYTKWIAFGLLIIGGGLVANEDASSYMDLAGKADNAKYGGNAGRATDHTPMTGNNSSVDISTTGIYSYLFWGSMIVLAFAFILGWVI